jgi:hypothetical protein
MNPIKRRSRPSDSLAFSKVFPARPQPAWCRRISMLKRVANEPKFAFMRTLFGVHEDDFLGLCMALGYIGQNWAMIEQNFDMWIAMIYHSLGGRQRVDPSLPISFSRKVRFLRRSFNQIAALKPFAAEAIPLIDQAKRLSKTRNDLAHGVLMAMKPVDGKWHMGVFDYETPQQGTHWHRLREFTFSPADFQFLEAHLVPLAGKVAKLGLRLRDAIP